MQEDEDFEDPDLADLEDLASDEDDEDPEGDEAEAEAEAEASETLPQKGPSRRMTPGRGFGPRRTKLTPDEIRKEMLETYGPPDLHET